MQASMLNIFSDFCFENDLGVSIYAWLLGQTIANSIMVLCSEAY